MPNLFRHPSNNVFMVIKEVFIRVGCRNKFGMTASGFIKSNGINSIVIILAEPTALAGLVSASLQ